MDFLPESTVRFFARIFGITPPAEEIGTTLAGNPSDRAGRPAWTWWIVLTLMSGGLLSMVVAISVIDPPRGVNLPPLPPALRPAVIRNPCTVIPMTDAELELLVSLRWPELQERLHREPLPRTDQTLQDDVDAAFEPIYAQIPKFLDWHYSVTGQYTQLAQVILEWLESEIVQAVLDRLHAPQLFSDLPDRVLHASAHVEKVMKEEMRALVEEQIRAEAATLPTSWYAGTTMPCAERDAYERMLTVAIPETVRRLTDSAVPTTIIAVGAAFRGAAAARRFVSRLSGRLLSRTASGLVARVLGALAGPATWLLVDVVVLFADEHFNRDDLEAELTALIDEQKAEVKAALSEAVAEEKSEALGVFLPSELDGRR